MPISLTYNMDCLEAMRQMQDNEFDLAIVDPPYGIGVSNYSTFGNPKIIAKNSFLKKPIKASGYKKSEWDNKIPDISYFNELKRVSKNQIIWGVNYFDGFGLSGGVLFWDKEGTGNYSRGELAHLSFLNRVEYFKYKWCGMLQEDMKNKEQRIHQTQKPIALYKWLLSNYAKQGDKILDTHLGSQSSRIAAYDMGFDFVGYELDTDYFNDGNKRFEQFKAQLKLF